MYGVIRSRKCILYVRNSANNWAWEYLWKNWYNPQWENSNLIRYAPSKWRIWARAIHSEVPIIHSNAPVESSWSVMKMKYIRGSRPKPEVLIDLIMNFYLARQIALVNEYREIQDPEKPKWYFDLYLLLTIHLFGSGRLPVLWLRRNIDSSEMG